MTVETVQIGSATEPAECDPACRIGFNGCPYRSCAIAGACMAPAPSDDHEEIE